MGARLPAFLLAALFVVPGCLGPEALQASRGRNDTTPTPPTPTPTPVTSPPTRPGDVPDGWWPQYGYTVAGQRNPPAERALTPANVAQLEVLWTAPFKGAATGTPVVAGGRVFVGTWDGVAHALAARTGAPLWATTLGAGVTASLAATEDAVYAGDAAGWLHRLDPRTGEEVWRTLLDPEPATHLYASPLVVGGIIYQGIASDQESVRLYPNGTLTFHGGVVAVDAATGHVVWRTYTQRPDQDGTGGSVWASPVLDGTTGFLYIATGNAYSAPEGPRVESILALNASDGAVQWVFKANQDDVFTQREPHNPDWDFGSSPVLWRDAAAGRTLVAAAQKSSVVWARDALTGQAVWQNGHPESGDGAIASPAVKDGVLFLPFVSKHLVRAINLSDGATLWDRDLGAGMWSAPAVVPGVLFVGLSDGHLVALEASTGRDLARFATGRGGIFGGISVAGGVVYTATVPKGFLGQEGALVAWAVPADGQANS